MLALADNAIYHHQASTILASLTVDWTLHAQLLSYGVVPALLNLSSSSSPDIKGGAVLALTNLLRNRNVEETVILENGLKAVLDNANTTDEAILHSIVQALYSISLSEIIMSMTWVRPVVQGEAPSPRYVFVLK